ncbi:MAG: NDP-hexose 2,3-dehydratase family protein, partial [Chloroflexi bacterium]|nr:NDP-hexose 2,3-dehydratase family protein [Chloroflexota bacterium]
MSSARDRILALLRDEGYEVTPDLEARLDHFMECIHHPSDPDGVEQVLIWLEERRRACRMEVEEIPMQQLERWRVDPETGAISHQTGEFFRVIGINVRNASQRESANWSQPIIYQPEMGILGILVQRRNGVDHYLLHAKAEPGNIGKVQLSPTLQSTVSNLRRAHGGLKSPFAELFETPRPGSVIFARYQGEDGGRLHLKKNLNMLVRVPEDQELEITDDFIWVTMYQIKQLLKHENVVNIA